MYELSFYKCSELPHAAGIYTERPPCCSSSILVLFEVGSRNGLSKQRSEGVCYPGSWTARNVLQCMWGMLADRYNCPLGRTVWESTWQLLSKDYWLWLQNHPETNGSNMWIWTRSPVHVIIRIDIEPKLHKPICAWSIFSPPPQSWLSLHLAQTCTKHESTVLLNIALLLINHQKPVLRGSVSIFIELILRGAHHQLNPQSA